MTAKRDKAQVEAAIEHGFYCRYVLDPNGYHEHYERCTKLDKGAQPDINRIHPFYGFRWDSKAQKWVKS